MTFRDPVSAKPLAVVTGASTGIGFELARCCLDAGFDLVIVADEAEIHQAASRLAREAATIEAIEADLATERGRHDLFALIGSRRVDALLANAGIGLGEAFLDQDFANVTQLLRTNIEGTLAVVHSIAHGMRARRTGRILITGSIAAYVAGPFQAAYNASKAFINQFALALREELGGTGVSVTCLAPGITESEFFRRAGQLDTKAGRSKKDDPRMVARIGFDAMMRGDAFVISGWKNKLQIAVARCLPNNLLARLHRPWSEPER